MDEMPSARTLWGRFPTSWFVESIARLQDVQKRHAPGSDVHEGCSKRLAPLFAEMAARQADNGGEPDWRKWK